MQNEEDFERDSEVKSMGYLNRNLFVDPHPLAGLTEKPKLTKLRRVEKNEDEKKAEDNLIFELPRKSCYQIAPELRRMMKNDSSFKANVMQHRVHVLKKIMKKAKIKSIEKHWKYVNNLDLSDRIIPHGEVSKKLFYEIFNRRDFDLYGQLMNSTPPHPPRKYFEMKALSEKLNIEFTQKLDENIVIDENLFDDDESEQLANANNSLILKGPKLRTENWKIGHEQHLNAPVGLANNPSQPFNSLGNEEFFSYDGQWKHGKLHGFGRYLFTDGSIYEGNFENNHPNGKGSITYLESQSYVGDWSHGRYEGNGKLSLRSGSSYDGEYSFGRRHGYGKLCYPSGLIYEGEFYDGKPSGRGKIISKLTGWSYEGTFEKGNISGMGQLITPPPDRKHIIYYWPENKEPITFPALVKFHVEKLEEERLETERIRNEMMAPLRGNLLKSYVDGIRSGLYNERLKEKKDKYNEVIMKIKEQKARLYEARLKALAGDEE